MQQIESNPANPLDPNASNELEKLRQQLSQAIDYQNQMNDAVNALDVSRANTLYQQLNNIISRTEQEIRDNTDAQGRFNSSINQGANSANSLRGALGKVAGAFGLYKIGDEIMQTATQAVSFASDLQEVQNVVDVTFGASSEMVDEWSTTTLDAYGLNELSAKQYAGTMGAMLKSSGLASDSAREMSMTVTELAGDMASFYNLSGDDAFQKIRSGLSGETEPLKALGINMSVANLEAYALSQGIKTSYNEMSQAEQVMLRYNYLLSATSDAQGDFARTSDSYANQTKLMKENWSSLTGEIAAGVLPYLAQIIQTVNGIIATMRPYTGQISSAFGIVFSVAGKMLNVVAKIGNFFIQNWGMISPVIFGIVAALSVYAAYLGITKAAELASNGVKILSCIASYAHAAATKTQVAAITAQTAAQYGLNTAMLASPVTWIILGIIALIAVIFIVINAIQKVTGTTTSACGMIFGAVCWLGALILNTVIGTLNGIMQLMWSIFITPFLGIIEWILNVCTGGFDSFSGAVANLIGNVISWFLSLGKVVTTIIDAIFGTEWTAGLSSLQNEVLSWGKTENAITISRDAPIIDYRMDMTQAYNWGATKGDNFWNGIKDNFSFTNNFEDDALNKTAEYTSSIATSTDDISDTISSVSDEELEWLRKITERDAVNKFTTAEIKLDFSSTATLNSDMDIDGYINTFTSELQDALVTTAEGLEK